MQSLYYGQCVKGIEDRLERKCPFCTILVQWARMTAPFSIYLTFAQLPRESIKKYIFPLFDCCCVRARLFELQGFNGPSRITLYTLTEFFAFFRR